MPVKINLFFALVKVENDLAKFVKVDEVQDLQFVDRENLIVEEDEVLTSKINDYLNFVYKNINLSKVEFKNSVTKAT